MKKTYHIQTWYNYYDRDQGFMEQEDVEYKTLDQVKAHVDFFYNMIIKESRGSMEVLDENYNTLLHISEDSNHLIKEVV